MSERDASCGTCRFFHLSAVAEEGECRRHTPAMWDDANTARWPSVDSDDWCGEFEQRLCGVVGCVRPDGHVDRWHRLIDGKLMQVVTEEASDG